MIIDVYQSFFSAAICAENQAKKNAAWAAFSYLVFRELQEIGS
jgi:hypothetical protein